MSDYMGDLSQYLTVSSTAGSQVTRSTDKTNLNMDDFLMLMVAQFQNQSIDETASTTDMLNQLVQMSMIQAITNITDATVMMYAGSLVGKEVTIGQYNSSGKLEEIVGMVTGTGLSGGQQVVFVNGKSYYLNEIMAVGRLPETEQPGDGEEGETDQTPPADQTESQG